MGIQSSTCVCIQRFYYLTIRRELYIIEYKEQEKR